MRTGLHDADALDFVDLGIRQIAMELWRTVDSILRVRWGIPLETFWARSG